LIFTTEIGFLPLVCGLIRGRNCSEIQKQKIERKIMSNKNYAHLCWGFPLLDSDGNPLEFLQEGQGVDEFIASALGLKKPTVPFKGNEGAFKTYWDAEHKIVRESGITLWYHDIDRESQVPIITISDDGANHLASSRDNPTSLPPVLEVKSEWKGILQEFCRKANLPFQEPHWVLAVSWDH
jgi:hypothetical protein